MQEKKFDCKALPKFASSQQAGFSVGIEVAAQQAGGFQFNVTDKYNFVADYRTVRGEKFCRIVLARCEKIN